MNDTELAVRLHAHVADPRRMFETAARFGRVEGSKADDMHAQARTAAGASSRTSSTRTSTTGCPCGPPVASASRTSSWKVSRPSKRPSGSALSLPAAGTMTMSREPPGCRGRPSATSSTTPA